MSQLGLVTVLCLLAGSVISQESAPSPNKLPNGIPKLPSGGVEKMENLENDSPEASLPKIPVGNRMLGDIEAPKIPEKKTPGSDVQSDDVISPRFLMQVLELREMNQPEDKGFSKSPYENMP